CASFTPSPAAPTSRVSKPSACSCSAIAPRRSWPSSTMRRVLRCAMVRRKHHKGPVRQRDLRVIFIATADGWLDLGDRRVRCALGRAGVTAAAAKREGDGASPAGVWPIREVWYRPDRGPPPATEVRVHAMSQADG